MKLSTKLGIGAIILVLIALIIWGFPIVFNRYEDWDQGKSEQEIADEAAEKEEARLESEDGDMPEEEAPEVTDEDLAGEGDEFLQISSGDCNDGCKQYTEAEDLAYCEQVCGLAKVNEKANGCDALEDLEKDYCYKDLAVSKKDLKTCDKIEDSGIKKTCKNRIAEDIIENPGSEPEL